MYSIDNFILATDGYKASHYLQLPPNSTYSQSYIESRGGKYNSVVMFGLQIFLQDLSRVVITRENVDEAREFFKHYMPNLTFNTSGWEIIVNEFAGKLPLKICALEEGTVVPTGCAMVTVENTDPRFAWLPQYIETILLRAVWYPSTVATNSRELKKLIWGALVESATDPNQKINYMLHDFGARGVSSGTSAAIGGAAHLINFRGSDTLEGVLALQQYYGASMPAASVPAAEHSTITSWGRDHEQSSYNNIIQQFSGKDNTYSVVSDSYDLMNAVVHIWGEDLKHRVVKSGGTLVIRPDSGNPLTVPVDCLHSLAKSFGYSVNEKNYKVLHPAVRVLQGDGITQETLPELIGNVLNAGFSIENLVFGMGGGLLQIVNRDDQKFAQKMCSITVNGQEQDVFKQPKGDASKASKGGRLAVVNQNNQLVTVRERSTSEENLLKTVWLNGSIINPTNYNTVVDNLNKYPL